MSIPCLVAPRRAAQFGGLLAALFFAAPAAAQPAPKPPQAVVGVWYQPVSSFDKWKARGVNTMFGYEGEGGNVSREQWTAAAREKGLFYITQASPNLVKDSDDPWLLAWVHKDEPDSTGNMTPEQLAADYKAFKDASASKPVAVVFDGRKMQWRPEADYAAFARSADWLLEDFYALNYGDGPEGIPTKGKRLDTLRKLAGSSKRVGSVFEVSDQGIGKQDWTKVAMPGREKQLCEYMRGPTGPEILAEFQVAKEHGAALFVLFPDKIGKNWEGFDGMTEEQTAAVTQAIAKVAPPPAPVKPDTRKPGGGTGRSPGK